MLETRSILSRLKGDGEPILGSQGGSALASKLPPFLELPQPAGAASQSNDTAVVGSPGHTAPASKVLRFLELPQPAGEATEV